jgi:hypothetical protein
MDTGPFQEPQDMRKHLLAAGIAAAALIPTFAVAQQTCEQQHQNRVAGTVVGAGLGALLGAAIAGRNNTGAGVVVGGLGGAVVGNQLTRPTEDCAHAYGYYDSNGRWHANAVARGYASGYYDRSGAWVDGAPNGYYDSQERWVPATSSADASGYYDRDGRWVPASSAGYYDTNGQWVAGAASGHYDRGRWIAGPVTGHYDRSGRWVAGQPSGHRDVNGDWVADAQPGYYDTRGRWIAGSATGYYDDQGRWNATAAAAAADRGSDVAYESYQGRSDWGDARPGVQAHEAWLERRIRSELNDGTLSRSEAYQALRPLNSIRREETSRRGYDGRLSPRDEAYFGAELDNLNNSTR